MPRLGSRVRIPSPAPVFQCFRRWSLCCPKRDCSLRFIGVLIGTVYSGRKPNRPSLGVMATSGPGAECPVFVLGEQKRTNPTYLHTSLQSAVPNCHPPKLRSIWPVSTNLVVGSKTSKIHRISDAANAQRIRGINSRTTGDVIA